MSGLWLLMALTLTSTEPLNPEPLKEALARFERLDGYRLQLRSEGPDGNQHLLYAYRKPGLVRMDVLSPYAGAVLVYSPYRQQVRLWPFGLSWPSVNLSPDHPLVTSPRGHRVDKSDVGVLLRKVLQMQKTGQTPVQNEAHISGRAARHLVVLGPDGPGEAARYELWLDRESWFPLKVVSSDSRGNRLETVWLEQIELDPVFPDHFFFPE
ncbi:LolA family protein [Oceanisphaera sp. KMM 10153]|uniref:LolA family protein n=1 Tax=Oceanisphaera submarina TaxID=3390193 RepID=UPI0039752781